MNVAADASVLVAESLRRRRHRLIGHQDVVFYIAEPTWSEVVHEIGRRLDAMVVHGRFQATDRELVLGDTLALLTQHITVVPVAEYQEHEAAARARIPRDPNDWPTVAVALVLDADIWTMDYDFFGCGLPVWTTDTLMTHMDT